MDVALAGTEVPVPVAVAAVVEAAFVTETGVLTPGTCTHQHSLPHPIPFVLSHT